MPISISPPPERDFPPGHQVRRRQQLVDIVKAEGGPARRRAWVPLVAAASVVALVGGAVVAAQALRPDGTPRVTGGDTATRSSSPTDTQPAERAEPAKPVIREITGAELDQFFDDCRDAAFAANPGYEYNPASFKTFQRPSFAFTADWGGSSRSWLVAVRGDGKRVDDRAICTRDESGRVDPAGRVLSHNAKGDGYLYQIVAGGAHGAGFLMPQVETVTFQPKAGRGVESSAVVRDGMWFYPEEAPYTAGDPGHELIRLPDAYYRYRGYDADGKLIYDSERDGPFAKDCYTDPAGKEVIVVNSAKNPTPQTCNRTYEWTAP